jgi:pimeloyl-ACP methyl ester carboxylesterase
MSLLEGRLRKAILIFTIAMLGIAGLLVAGSSAHAGASTIARASDAKPTVVLVHGAWADSSSWDAVIARLQQDGYTVVAPANPLRSLTGDATYLASFLSSISGPIVLVGHSYGGAVITDAATGNPNVKALVYIDAFAPDAGESVLQLASKYPGSLLPSAITEVPYSQGPDGSGIDVYINPADYRAAFAADVAPGKAELMAATQRPISLAALVEPSGPPAWKTIPSWYLVGTDDQAIPPATQRFMAARAGSHTVEIDSSHASLVSHPGAVTDLILSAIQSVG